MVIVRLIGGLGNQMFQYAAGRALAELNQTTLKLDIAGFDTYKLHKYGLDNFMITASVASDDEIKKLVGRTRRGAGVCRLTNLIRPYYRRSVVQERHFHFDPDILKAGPNVYLSGYWQSEKYFKAVADILRREFVVKHPPDQNNQEIAQEVKSTNSVSLHVRRGDYVSDSGTHQVHGSCSLEYYRQALDILAKRVSRPQFFVFSDDIEWVKEHLDIGFPATFVSHNGPKRNYEDLRLMSLCRHHIIANSSFSWWGAWLSSWEGKQVIAPRRWLNSQEHNTADVLPDTWERI